MRKKILIVLLFIFVYPLASRAQVQSLIVETYYVSDANDATDSTNYYADSSYGMPVLAAGSKTYRVFIQLAPGSKLISVFGDINHTLRISSTQNFYNNIDRPNANFGYLINKVWFPGNPTLALDSWLSLGLATRTESGILKSDDTNGSFIGGGLLANTSIEIGIPLTVADGLYPDTTTYSQWLDNGFKDILNGNLDTTVFGPVNIGSEFISNDAFLQQNSGVEPVIGNKVLVAQLTTLGEISFELNVEVEEHVGSVTNIVKYVAALASGENTSETLHLSPFLTYPPVCGCTDPNYLEYNAAYACSNSDSCQTRIVFGCMDPMACNYKADANFNVAELCCYPGYCNDRNIELVCPVLGTKKMLLYPNPAQDVVTLEISSDVSEETKYGVYDAFGRLMLEQNISVTSGTSAIKVDVSSLSKGVYMFKLLSANSESRMFLKN